MTRCWMGCLLVAGAAFAQQTEARPIDRMPWSLSLQEALDEAAERGAPLAVYLYIEGQEGEAPRAIGASEATQTLYGFALWRVDVSKESEACEEVKRRWGTACDLSQTPALHLIGPDGVWRGRVEPVFDATELLETCQAILGQLDARPIDAGYYRNAHQAWKRASEAIAKGNATGALPDLELVVDIAKNCGRDFRFTSEARKRYDELMADGRARLDELRTALEAKDWPRVWELGRKLADAYQLTALGAEVGDVLAAIDGDPEAGAAIGEIAAREKKASAETFLAEAARQRIPALLALRTRIQEEEVSNEAVTVVFYGEGTRLHRTDENSWQSIPFKAAGYWINEDRAVVLTDGLPLPGAGGEEVDFVDLRPRDDVERKVMALMRKHTRWDGRPVVPVSIKPGEHGKLNVTYFDGLASDRPDDPTWPCSRWSYGFVAVDVVAGTVEDRGHSK